MHLAEINIMNYRSCGNLGVKLSVDSPNIFIGLNDSGKSTVLNALSLLIGDKSTFNYLSEGSSKNDISNTPKTPDEINQVLSDLGLPPINDIADSACVIVGKLIYDDKESEGFADSNLSTSLQWSIESNRDNELWLVKTFSAQTERFLLIQSDSKGENLELWNKSQTEISKKVKDLKVTSKEIDNQNGKGRFSNFEKIRAVYSKMETTLQWSDYKFSKDDKGVFPVFNLYDWNSTLRDVLNAATSIMKEEIDSYLKPVKQNAVKEALKAEEEINNKFGGLLKTINSVAKDIEEISSKVYFDVNEKVSDVMVKKTNSDGPIHLENQGEGLKRQIWFSLIKAKASEENNKPNQFIWAFDEPETHLYPGAQREFIDILKKMSQGNVQTVVSTHSTIFIDKANLKQIRRVSQDSKGYTQIDSCENVDSIYESLSVKNSDFLFYDKFLVVEGDTEEYLIPMLYKLYTGHTLLDHNIQLVQAKGKSNWTVTKSLIERLMEGFNKSSESILYLFDNDAKYTIGESAQTDEMYFVGIQDIEDAIDSNIWVSILSSFYNGRMEVDLKWVNSIKANVIVGAYCRSDQKFDKLLRSRIRSKWVEEGGNPDELTLPPSKGFNSAEFIFKGMTDRDDIPETIRQCFDKLNDR